MAEVVVALDLSSFRETIALLDRLPDLRWAKVGPVTFVRDGHRTISELTDRGINVFLDLKWHDIPSAVGGAVRSAAKLGVRLATVHALGGSEMMETAAPERGSMDLVAVTVLTSHTAASYASTVSGFGGSDLSSQVLRLSELARDAGLQGVVCSAYEAGPVKELFGSEGIVVVPGIRLTGAAEGDQRRVADPGTAARAGATHLVIGRPITQASNPRSAFDAVVEAAARWSPRS